MIHLPYEGIELAEVIAIERIYSVHYFEYAKSFVFEGEQHDFWEFICVDRGEVSVARGEERLLLRRNQIAFHEPGEFHDVRATDQTAPDIMVISFACHNPAMAYFRKKVFSVTEEERGLLGAILKEARSVLANPLDNPYTYQLVLKEDHRQEAEQLITVYLTEFLLRLMRRTGDHPLMKACPESPKRLTWTNDMAEKYSRVCRYLEKHIGEMLTIEKISRDNMVSRSQLFYLFKKEENHGPLEAFHRMKIAKAKVLIRQTNEQFSQIAINLGYSSLSHFSKMFKQVTGMSPSEYAKSIMALSENVPD